MSESSQPAAPVYVGDGSYWDPKFQLVDEEQYRRDHPLNHDYQQNEGHPDPDPARNRTENVFTKYGYEWLGPGTDVEWNMQNNVQPIDALDAAGKQHDLEYYSIKQALQYGELTYDQAVRAVSAADRRLQIAASKVGGGDFVQWGMGLKQGWDSYFGTPSWSGIAREMYQTADRPGSNWRKDPSRYPQLDPGSDYFWWWNTRFNEWELIPTDNWEFYHPGQPTYSGTPHDPGSYDTYLPMPGYGEQPRYNWDWNQYTTLPPDTNISSGGYSGPEVPISAYTDRNRNGIPDVLEKKHKKRRRVHFKFSRRK